MFALCYCALLLLMGHELCLDMVEIENNEYLNTWAFFKISIVFHKVEFLLVSENLKLCIN